MRITTLPVFIIAALLLTACSERHDKAEAAESIEASEHSSGVGTDQGDHESPDERIGHEADAQILTAAGLLSTLPDGWTEQQPSNAMRIAQVIADTDAGQAVAAFSVARGGADANVMRWVGQFSNAEGEVLQSREDTTIAGHAVTIVEMAGEYRGMGMAPAQPDTVMRAAIISLENDEQLFIKMTGSRAAMASLADGWNDLIHGFHAE